MVLITINITHEFIAGIDENIQGRHKPYFEEPLAQISYINADNQTAGYTQPQGGGGLGSGSFL